MPLELAILVIVQYDVHMYKKLGEIADITSGYTFRSSINHYADGDYFVVQARNIDTDKNIDNVADLTLVYSGIIRNPFFLEPNDILIVSRGSRPGSFRSTVFSSDKKNVIASSSVHIIRVADVIILPKYLSLYLNSPDGQKELSQIVTGGSYIQSILLKNLSGLKIPIPPVHVQKSIVALHENMKRQEDIQGRKRQLKENIINATFNNLTHK